MTRTRSGLEVGDNCRFCHLTASLLRSKGGNLNPLITSESVIRCNENGLQRSSSSYLTKLVRNHLSNGVLLIEMIIVYLIHLSDRFLSLCNSVRVQTSRKLSRI